MPPRKPTAPHRHTPPVTHEVVDPRWILSAFAIMVLIAVVCAYATMCTLFYRGQWQLAMQPSRSIAQTPAAINLPFSEVHFGVDASGQPQLDGWWIPSESPTAPTALVLHSGNGSMSDALPDAHILHDTGLNVLLFDYRGFGHSGGQHPTQSFMQADAVSALRYLTGTRNIPVAQIIPFGEGIGASLAVDLCTQHHDLKTLILKNADGDIDRRAAQDTRSRMVPARLLFNQDFPLANPLHELATPKLLITVATGNAPDVFHQAADPKTTVELPLDSAPQASVQAITRFLTDNGYPSLPLAANP